MIRRFKDAGAILTDDHFVLAGEDHTDKYFEKRRALISTEDLADYCFSIAYRWMDEGIEAVIGPATVGIKIATGVSMELRRLTGRNILSLFTEKDSKGEQVLLAGADLIEGKHILVVDDIGTTGGSLAAVVQACEAVGGIVYGCSLIIDKSEGLITADSLGVEKVISLAKISIRTYPDDGSCPHCQEQIRINTVYGHGKEYLRKNPEKKKWTKRREEARPE